MPVVMAAPISTTNITGLRIWIRGSSFRSEAQQAGTMMSRVKSGLGVRVERVSVVMRALAARRPGRGRG